MYNYVKNIECKNEKCYYFLEKVLVTTDVKDRLIKELSSYLKFAI